MRTPETTDEMDRMRAARPEVDDSTISPDSPAAHALVASIVSSEPASRQTPRATPSRSHTRNRRPGALVAIAAGAAVIAVGGALVVNAGGAGTKGTAAISTASTAPASQPAVALVNIRTVAARSARAALAGTGRAEISFDDSEGHDAGTTDLSFSGPDVEMVIHFAGVNGQPGSDAQNRTVGGQFYLYTPGPDAVTRWYHDTTATNPSVFDTDPRTLLGVLAPAAGFVAVGQDTIDGVAVTHLRATQLAAVPALNLSLGPIDPRDVTALDLWVGADNVVRRLDVTSESKVKEFDPKSAPKFEKSPDGAITLIEPNGNTIPVTKGENVEALLNGLPTVTRTVQSSYSVRFFDIGSPITITAPPNATDIAAKG